MSGSVAALPMYDWPEVRDATDRLWASIRDAMGAGGLAAPQRLDRARDPRAIWTDPLLALAQTCGLPFVRDLAGRVTMVGAFDYGVTGAPFGFYRSAIVVRADDGRDRLEDFRGARAALNGRDSQSGYAALLHHAAPYARERRYFGDAVVTGSHDASAMLVARGGADIAAIDYVSWRLIRRYRPEAAWLRELFLTDPTPGLPLIAGPGADPAPYRAAVETGVAGLDAEARDLLGIQGFRAFEASDYLFLRERLAAAELGLEL